MESLKRGNIKLFNGISHSIAVGYQHRVINIS